MAALLVGVSALEVPPVVPRLTVVNPSVYQVHLEVTDAKRHGGLGLGPVERDETKTFEEVIDQGQEWIFRFSYSGVQAGELVFARHELEADSWRVTIPAEVAERLAAAGIGPSSR